MFAAPFKSDSSVSDSIIIDLVIKYFEAMECPFNIMEKMLPNTDLETAYKELKSIYVALKNDYEACDKKNDHQNIGM